jgi:hypothetical protein
MLCFNVPSTDELWLTVGGNWFIVPADGDEDLERLQDNEELVRSNDCDC